MEIGPIAAIRPAPVTNRSRSVEGLAGVFAVEFRKRDQEETYTPSQQQAARGLEAEEDEDLFGDDETDSAANYPLPGGGKINFFA